MILENNYSSPIYLDGSLIYGCPEKKENNEPKLLSSKTAAAKLKLLRKSPPETSAPPRGTLILCRFNPLSASEANDP
eukprot:m.202705 g.202705  ORF g.202705 m.202705 type:complete len:77 (-) comp15752_c1_seq7:1588-1818(-)